MPFESLILENLTLFRTLLFLCCGGYWWILYAWTRPSVQAVRAGALAALVQFWVGLVVDIGLVAAGVWTYHQLPFSIAGVPIDLHIDWSLLWGFGLVWLSDRILGEQSTLWQATLYIFAWTGFTLAFDMTMADWMLFLDDVHPLWWVVDLIFLVSVQGLTLWFYRSIGTADETRCGLGPLPPLRPYIRSLTYLSFAGLFFFLYLPPQIEAAGRLIGFTIDPDPIGSPGLISFIVLMAFALGGWATHEFARRGRGTPIPWDPPRYLVDSGPYAFTANPMQQSGVLLAVAVLLYRPSWLMLGFMVDIIVIVNLVFILFENRGLAQRYEDVYQRYHQQIKLWRYRLWPRQRLEPYRPIIFYDSECGLCQWTMRFIIALDQEQVLRLAPRLSQTAQAVLPPHFLAQTNQAWFFWEPGLADDQPSLTSTRATAVLRLLNYMPLPLSFLAAFEGLPGFTTGADFLYRGVATIRHKILPYSADTCLRLQKDARYLN